MIGFPYICSDFIIFISNNTFFHNIYIEVYRRYPFENRTCITFTFISYNSSKNKGYTIFGKTTRVQFNAFDLSSIN